jgi:ubiquinone/menaquinone biosynthesis C-methylase UbiE
VFDYIKLIPFLRWLPVALLTSVAVAQAADVPLIGGPYVPTPQRVVDEMLRVAGVTQSDFVIDLGSGDGRIVITAAQKYGARGRGYDIDASLVAGSTAAARKLGLEQRVSFREEDVLKADVRDATVVTLYLLPAMMHELRAKLLRELKPGTRIVSHDFDFSTWKPDRSVTIEMDEKYGVAGSWTSTILLWTVPQPVAR